MRYTENVIIYQINYHLKAIFITTQQITEQLQLSDLYQCNIIKRQYISFSLGYSKYLLNIVNLSDRLQYPCLQIFSEILNLIKKSHDAAATTKWPVSM